MTDKRRRSFHSWLPQCVAITLSVMLAAPSRAVPSFARQTGMACAACHTVFPELTPFGREFKLNGYVLDNLKQITGITLDNRQTLSLNSLPPISLMLQLSYTHTSKALPDSALTGELAKNGDFLFPQQASLFYAGKIADNLGAFVQLTYDGVGDSFGFDNTDIRYARHIDLSGGGKESNGKDLVIGVTVNNGPTVQDVWNTTAAWGFPYSGSSVSPGPITSTKLEAGAGGIGQNAAGIGVYAWYDSQPIRRVLGLHRGDPRRRASARQHAKQRRARRLAVLAPGVRVSLEPQFHLARYLRDHRANAPRQRHAAARADR